LTPSALPLPPRIKCTPPPMHPRHRHPVGERIKRHPVGDDARAIWPFDPVGLWVHPVGLPSGAICTQWVRETCTQWVLLGPWRQLRLSRMRGKRYNDFETAQRIRKSQNQPPKIKGQLVATLSLSTQWVGKTHNRTRPRIALPGKQIPAKLTSIYFTNLGFPLA
jgi:hypothetical protein